MITDIDVKKLKETFATKEELAEVRLELGDVKDTVHRIEITLDKVAGAINDLRTENGAGIAHFARHDRQIAALAAHSGIALPE